eukprot:6412310-Pyramimonas_sp.AAC.1
MLRPVFVIVSDEEEDVEEVDEEVMDNVADEEEDAPQEEEEHEDDEEDDADDEDDDEDDDIEEEGEEDDTGVDGEWWCNPPVDWHGLPYQMFLAKLNTLGYSTWSVPRKRIARRIWARPYQRGADDTQN